MYLVLSTKNKEHIEELIRIAKVDFTKKVAFFDIDDTLIDSMTNQRIEHVFDIYKLLQSKGVRMVLITARAHSIFSVNYTRNQLDMLGIQYDQLYLRPEDSLNLFLFKGLCRRFDAEMFPRQVLCSVGDQMWDIGPGMGTSWNGVPILVNEI